MNKLNIKYQSILTILAIALSGSLILTSCDQSSNRMHDEGEHMEEMHDTGEHMDMDEMHDAREHMDESGMHDSNQFKSEQGDMIADLKDMKIAVMHRISEIKTEMDEASEKTKSDFKSEIERLNKLKDQLNASLYKAENAVNETREETRSEVNDVVRSVEKEMMEV